MLNETQLVIAVAGVCVLALVLIVMGRRRRNAVGRAEARTEALTEVRTDDHVVTAVEVDDAGRLVLARTHDGTQYQGTLAATNDVHTQGAYLTLTGPIVYRRSGGEPETMPSAWDRLALPLVDVAEVWTRPARVSTDEAVSTDQAVSSDQGGERVSGGLRDDDRDTDDPSTDRTSVAQSRSSRRHARGNTNTAVPTS